MLLLLASFAITKGATLPAHYASQAVPSRFSGKTVLNKPGLLPQKLIALTFDDGPNPAVTPKILQTLKDHNAKATFFVLGRWAQKYPELVKRQVDEGHVVGSHTWTHPARPSRTKAGPELWKTAKAIFYATGQWPSTFRPPYGIDKSWTARIARHEGYSSVLWTKIGPDTVKNPSAQKIAEQVIREARSGDIVLFHDALGKSYTAEAVPTILAELGKKGFRFVTITEMMQAWDQEFVAQAERRKQARLARLNRMQAKAKTL